MTGARLRGLHRWGAWRLAEARAALSLRRLSGSRADLAKDGIGVFAVCRNERLRLPHFLAYYRELGVDRFFIADNGSDDGSTDYLAAQADVTTFSTAQRYDEALYGVRWQHALLRRFGRGRWCLVADTDELFVYPHMEQVTLRELCACLDAEGATALPALLVDMYARGPIEDARPGPAGGLLECCPWFDPDGYFEHDGFTTGGPRVRVFGMRPCVDKVPLLRFGRGVSLRAGCHQVDGVRYSALRAGMLHFKFLEDFARRAAEEAVRKQHWRDGEEYAAYVRALEQEKARVLWYPGARRFGSSDDLLSCGLMRSSGPLDALCGAPAGRTPDSDRGPGHLQD